MPYVVAAPNISPGQLPGPSDRGSRDAPQAYAERFRSLSQASPFGIFESDMEARILYVNPRLLAIWQMPLDETLGRGWLRRVHPEDRDRLVQGWSAALDTPCPFDCEYRLLMDDGSVRWVLGQAAPLHDSAGRVIGTVGTIQDVTHRRLAEQALRRSERHFRSLIENASDMISLLDSDGALLYLSPAHERVTGLPAAGLLGQGFLARIHPEDLPFAGEALEASLASPGEPVRVQLRHRHENGSWRTLSSTLTNLLGDPAVAGVVVNSHDVTERLQLETQLRQAQKMEAVGRLAGGVAHDFNNLLTVIAAHGQFALETLPGDAVEREDLLAIRQAAARASALTRQLLAFSRKQILQPRLLDLNATIPGVAGMLRRLIGEDVELATVLSSSACPIYADPGQVEQVIMNLAVNARDAMPAGGTLRITTSERHVSAAESRLHPGLRPGHYVSLAVEDTGTGISPAVLPHLFEPFYTTKEPGKGTGLGLATVYGVVKQSGGYVYVESTEGRGSSFTILLPYIQVTPGSGLPVEDDDPLPRGHETVLLVEDDAAVRAAARRSLEQQGYSVLEASNGTDAEAAWRREAGRISILVTDAVMPGLGGRALGERLRAGNPSLRVLVMSGYDRDALPSGAPPGHPSRMSVLQKPFTPDELARAVREALDAH